jgi:adiponectin receptor
LIVVLSVAFYFYPTSANFSLSTRSDVFIAAVFFFAACKCLVCSIMWHTFNSIAEQSLMERFACVDYTGISLLVGASVMTTQYCAFYCEPLSRSVYLTTTAVTSIAGSILPWNPTFNRPDMNWARVGFYIFLAATGFIPIGQLVYTRGFAWAWHFYRPLTMSLVVYVAGACVYAAKIPERWCPGGITDFVGSSHNLWHLAVIGGILFHFVAMQRFFSEAFVRASVECSVY